MFESLGRLLRDDADQSPNYKTYHSPLRGRSEIGLTNMTRTNKHGDGPNRLSSCLEFCVNLNGAIRSIDEPAVSRGVGG